MKLYIGLGMKNLTILCISFNDTNHVLEMLESLKNSTYKDFDTLIWNNNSNPSEALTKLENNKKIKLVNYDKNIGLTGGVNEALKLVKTKYVLLINPDTILDKDTIKELMGVMEKDEKIAFQTATIYNFKEKDKIDSFGGRISFFTGIGKPLKVEYNSRELKYGEYCDACCLMFNREVFNELGGYDDRYFAYAETEDVLFKAMKKGYKVYMNTRAKVWHKMFGSQGGKKSKFSVFHINRNRYLFMSKYVSFPRYILFIVISFLFIYPIQTILFIKRKQFDLILPFFKGIYHGITGKYGASFFQS